MPDYESINREYTKDDLEMMEQAQVFHDNFVLDQADFTAAFPKFLTPYETNFQTEINTADAIPPDSEVVQAIALVTEQIETQMELGRKAMQKLFVYVKVAFSDSQARLKSFGKSEYDKSRNSQLKLKELLEKANRQADVAANKTALLAAGYTQAAIDELKTISDEIDSLNAEQEDMKSERFKKTEDRIVQYNKVWAFLEEISEASKVVFVDSPAKLAQYLLYPAEHHGLSKPQNVDADYDPLEPLVVTLSWDLVAEATSYDVYYDIAETGAPAGDFELLDNYPTSPVVIPATYEKRNYFKLKAKNDEGTSSYSDEAWVDVPAGPA